MTTAIDAALVQAPAPRGPSDRQAARNKEAGQGFGDALRASGKRDAGPRVSADGMRRPLHVAARLDAVLDGQAGEAAGDPEAVGKALSGPADEASLPDDGGDEDAADPAAALLLALSGLHRPERPRGEQARGGEPGGQANGGASGAVAEAPPDRPKDKPQDRSQYAGPIVLRAGITPANGAEGAAQRPSGPAPGPVAAPTGEGEAKGAGDLRDRAAPRVTVLSLQGAVTPALQAPTAAALVESIASDAPFAEAVDRAALALRHAQAVPAPTHTLKLQLHPAELGLVTASLRLSGGQLAVELQVDNSEAYQRLAADGDAIVKALQGMGYEIDRVTILQPQAAATAAARADASGPSTQGGGRGADFAGSGAAGNGGSGARGEQTGGSGGHARQNDQQPRPVHRDGAGGGLYI